MLSWSYVPDHWGFDVASLMVLVGEHEELSYRLSDRSLLEAAAAAPVIGLQSYIRSYDFLLDGTSHTYFSPYGCKSAPLRNARLDNIISLQKLLEDGRYSAFRILHKPRKTALRAARFWTALWVAFTWACFGAILAFLLLVENTTWIGLINCIALSGWSIIARTMEHFLIKPAEIVEGTVTKSDAPDAIFILGRNRSAFVMEGTRMQIKNWATRGLTYSGDAISPIRAEICQIFTRFVTFLILMFVFITIPNGTTMDQSAFVLLNVLGQVNVLVGRLLNCWDCLAYLERLEEGTEPVISRTHIYALLLRRFKDLTLGKSDWVVAAGLLPLTDVWKEWRQRVVADKRVDAKELYNKILEEKEGK